MSKSRVLASPGSIRKSARAMRAAHALAAELFELDEFGNARVRGSGPDSTCPRRPGIDRQASAARSWRSRSSRRRRRRADICTLTTPSVAAIIPSGIEDSDGVERLR